MDCLPIPSITRHTLGLRLMDGAKEGRLPLAGLLEVTPYCNLKCAHCYMVHSHWDGHQLTSRQLCRILDEITEAGCLWLLFTGGEPFLRKDFLQIYAYAKKKGLLIVIFTNGTLVTEGVVQHLAEWKPLDVEITLYGATRETYQRMTGSADAFEQCRRAIELLLKAGVPLRLKTMVTSLNVHELPEMKRLARSLGLEFHFDPMINPGLDGSQQVCQVRLSPQEVLQVEIEDPEVRAGLEDLARRYFKPQAPPKDGLFTCGAGQTTFHIDAWGRLQPCILVREPSFDLTRGTFNEGFYQFIPSLISRKRTRFSACQVCSYRGMCQMCPGWSQLETGDLEESPVPYLCQVAHLRVQAVSSLGKGDNLSQNEALTRVPETGRQRG